MKQIVAIAGLPGSGKSRLAADLAAVLGWPRMNDPTIVRGKAGAAEAILRTLDGAPGVVLDDPYFCLAGTRADVAGAVDGATWRWVYFAPDHEACLRNILRDGGDRVLSRVRCLASVSHHYEIPEGAAVRPVWRPGDTA